MDNQFFEDHIKVENGPLIATAIHDGHTVRDSLQNLFHLNEQERLREEDPFTGAIARQFDNHLIALRSRFEVDLNRSPGKAVYRNPEDAWGLQVWRTPISDEQVQKSLELYHEFYRNAEKQIGALIDTYGFAIVFDLHSYNHRREGPDAPFASQEGNPDIDILTANIHLEKWQPVLDRFMDTLRQYPFPGRPLDVREEVRFDGKLSHFMQWILERFQDKVFVPSIELKKIFMDEWSGKVNPEMLEHLKKALKQTEEPILEEVKNNQNIESTL